MAAPKPAVDLADGAPGDTTARVEHGCSCPSEQIGLANSVLKAIYEYADGAGWIVLDVDGIKAHTPDYESAGRAIDRLIKLRRCVLFQVEPGLREDSDCNCGATSPLSSVSETQQQIVSMRQRAAYRMIYSGAYDHLHCRGGATNGGQ